MEALQGDRSTEIFSDNADFVANDTGPDTVAVPLTEASSLLHQSAKALREDIDGGASHSAHLIASEPDIVYALHDTLARGGVTHLDLPPDLGSAPDTISTVLTAGAEALKSRGLPDPDLDLYRSSMAEAQAGGTDFRDVLSDRLSREPLAVRADLPEVATIQLAAADEQVSLADGADAPVEAIQDSDAKYEAQVLENVGGTNFCEMNTLDRFENFIRWQDVEREVSEDFVTEQVAKTWEALPEEVRDYEPRGVGLFGVPSPYPRIADDIGNHENNQRFWGGYHIATEEGHPRVELHFDAHDPLGGVPGMLLHVRHEVNALERGDLTTTHYPEHNAPSSYEGRFADWERYEDHCAGL